jgi:hypothetical protein
MTRKLKAEELLFDNLVKVFGKEKTIESWIEFRKEHSDNELFAQAIIQSMIDFSDSEQEGIDRAYLHEVGADKLKPGPGLISLSSQVGTAATYSVDITKEDLKSIR